MPSGGADGARRAARDLEGRLPRDADRRGAARSVRRRRRAERPRSLAARQSCARCAGAGVHATAVPADLVEALVEGVLGLRDALARGASRRRLRRRAAGAAPRARPGRARSAAAKAAPLGKSPYEALLDEYEPGGSTAAIDRAVRRARRLPARLDRRRAGAPAGAAGAAAAAGPVPDRRAARSSALKLMERLGFDFEHGRLDVSLHPFCGGTPDDVRITTRYDEADFSRALMGVLHETGHALYERGLPAEWRRQPVGDARGMSIHESQSLLIEMQACRSREFAEFVAPLLREAFGGRGPAWDAENLYRLNTRVAAQPHPRRCRRGHLSGPCHPALPAGAGDDRRRSRARGSAGGVERRHARPARRRAARRSPGLPPGHPLVRRRLGLFPDLHAWAR